MVVTVLVIMMENPIEDMKTWFRGRLATTYVSSYMKQEKDPEAARRVGMVLGILKERPLEENLEIYRWMNGRESSYVAGKRYEIAARFRDMRELFYREVLG